ncbi:N-acetylmuramoyl-L-alanine amidase [[Clostridium] innocuum]|uniref:N-acetylmuramoyl-L-alanine amidase n=1 Tax=Clostridium innocuum TaxID=1522 RepID=UPI0022E8CDDE|nr:N-acetylmuramoyl-L-alanine amidase [[Clostridium] innocuum]
MKILLIAGHGAGDTGASGCGYKETNLTRELVNLIAPKLRKYANVDVYNVNRSAFYDVQNGNTIMCWKYISMHLMDPDTEQKSL